MIFARNLLRNGKNPVGRRLTSVGIVAAKRLEAFGGGFQPTAVVERIVDAEQGFGTGSSTDERFGRCRRLDVKLFRQPEETAECLERHAGGVRLAVR